MFTEKKKKPLNIKKTQIVWENEDRAIHYKEDQMR